MKKKGQIQGIITFVVITALVLMLAPIFLKINNLILGGVSDSIRPISNESADAIDFGKNKFSSLWDIVIVCFFVANVILLFVSAFLIDIHPAFIAIYIVGAFFIFMFSPNYLKATGAIFDNANFNTETQTLAGTSWIYNNFGFLLLGIVFITGIIMFAKYKFGGKPGGTY